MKKIVKKNFFKKNIKAKILSTLNNKKQNKQKYNET